MTGHGDLVAPGEDGAALFRDRLDSLKEIAIWDTDSDGRSTERRRWSIDLVKLLTRRAGDGTVYDGGEVEVPSGLLPYEEQSFPYAERNRRVLSRFLGGTDSRFCVVPSMWDADYPSRRPPDDSATGYFTFGEALYWLIQLPPESEARLSTFDDWAGLMCPWSPLALIGDDIFDGICQVLWTQELATAEQLEDLASHTSRIITEGTICGSYVLWEPSAAR